MWGPPTWGARRPTGGPPTHEWGPASPTSSGTQVDREREEPPSRDAGEHVFAVLADADEQGQELLLAAHRVADELPHRQGRQALTIARLLLRDVELVVRRRRDVHERAAHRLFARVRHAYVDGQRRGAGIERRRLRRDLIDEQPRRQCHVSHVYSA